jgi:hypothetical protein
MSQKKKNPAAAGRSYPSPKRKLQTLSNSGGDTQFPLGAHGHDGWREPSFSIVSPELVRQCAAGQKPKEMLLLSPHSRVFSVDQGWEPLCRFLGAAVPSTPFPNLNERAQMKRKIGGLVMISFAILAAVVFAVAALIFGAVKVFG